MPNSEAYRLPWPPSVNTYYRNVAIKGRPRTLISAKGRAYRKTVSRQLVGAKGFGAADIGISVLLHPPSRRKYDADNTLKAMLDALTHAGIWDDDSQVSEVYLLKVHHDNPKRDGGYVDITITERIET